MSEADLHRVERGLVLRILKAHADRRRDRGDHISTYCAEDYLQQVAANQGYPMLIEKLRGHLYYLRDKQLVKFHEVKDGHRIAGLMWRITAGGVDLIEGNVPADPGIYLP